MLSVTEARWLRHHLPPDAVPQLAVATGFVERATFRRWLINTLQFQKPLDPPPHAI